MAAKQEQGSTATPSAPQPLGRLCLLPAETYHKLAGVGASRPTNSIINEVVLGLLAGAFIGFGFTTCMLAAGQLSATFRAEQPGLFNLLFGIYGFPTGLGMVILTGANLFTGNVMFMMASWMERKTTLWQGTWVCVLSYLANLAGSLMLARMMISGEVFLGRETFTTALAVKKISQSFGTNLVRGMLCNWLVCMAIWQANTANDTAGKILGLFLPVSAFVTGGFEHCVANMFMLPLGIMLGAPFTVTDFIVKNLIPVTLGNTISGVIFVAMSFGFSYGTPEKTFRRMVEDKLFRVVKNKMEREDSKLPVMAVKAGSESDSELGGSTGNGFADDSCHNGRK